MSEEAGSRSISPRTLRSMRFGKWAASISYLGNTYVVPNTFEGKRIGDMP